MHLYAIVRGRRKLVRTFFENCEDIFLPWYKNKDKQDIFVNLVPRKVELVEFVFPEKYLPEVLKTITSLEKQDVNSWYKMDKSELMLRKGLGCEKIPEIKDFEKHHELGCRDGERVKHQNVAVHPIGIKFDLKNEDGIELL